MAILHWELVKNYNKFNSDIILVAKWKVPYTLNGVLEFHNWVCFKL